MTAVQNMAHNLRRLKEVGRWAQNGRMVSLRAIAALALAALVTACAEGASRISLLSRDVTGESSLIRYEAADGAMPTVIHGNPFPVGDPEAEASIRDALRMPAGLPRAAFVREAAAEAGRGIRVVIVFNPADAALDARKICRDVRVIALAPRRSEATIHAALCSGDKLAHALRARAAAGEAMDGRFRAALSLVMIYLLPAGPARPPNALN